MGTNFAGFDTYGCPDLTLLARLRKETNLVWVGFYLRAPSQPAFTWRGKRKSLVDQGWGLAPIYVGRQVTGPGAKLIASNEGVADGSDAALRMSEEGFPRGSFVYLDLENGPPMSELQRGYVILWIDAVRAAGYGAGVYCSFLLGHEIAALRPNLRVWVYHVPSTTPHFMNGVTFQTPDPSDSGFAGAVIWQRSDEAKLTAFQNLAVDLDVAVMADPSAPAGPVLAAAPPQPRLVSPAAAPAPPDIPMRAPAAPAAPAPHTGFWEGLGRRLDEMLHDA